MANGIDPYQLGDHVERYGGISFKVEVQTEAGTTEYQVFKGGSPYNGRLRVLGMSGIMTGAGAAADTVQLKDKDDNVITEAVDVSALSDKDKWDASQVDDAYYNLDAGDNLQIITASDALCRVYVELMRVES